MLRMVSCHPCLVYLRVRYPQQVWHFYTHAGLPEIMKAIISVPAGLPQKKKFLLQLKSAQD